MNKSILIRRSQIILLFLFDFYGFYHFQFKLCIYIYIYLYIYKYYLIECVKRFLFVKTQFQ